MKNEGKFALIKNNKLISVLPTFEDAIECGSPLGEPYSIKQIKERDLALSSLIARMINFREENMVVRSLPVVETICGKSEIPLTIRRLTETGRLRLEEIEQRADVARLQAAEKLIRDRKRQAERSWRMLFHEARTDISEDIWPFINWERPKFFDEKVRVHKFLIAVPGYVEFFAVYRAMSLDWHWIAWEYGDKPCHQFRDMEDLSLVFAMTKAEADGIMGQKSKVEIEEITNGKLEDDLPPPSIKKMKLAEPNVMVQA